MGYFKDAEEVYETLGRLFTEIVHDPEVGPKFRGANTIVRYEHTDPAAIITVIAMLGQEPAVLFGETDVAPEVTMRMAADVAHSFWQGHVNVMTAITRGQITTTGPVEKVLRLVPLTARVYPRYREQLAAMDRADLIEA